MLEETLTEWLHGAEEKARKEGRQEGRQEGRREGRREGLQTGHLEGMQQFLLGLLRQRFETVPVGVRRQVKAISSVKKLNELGKRVLTAHSLEELGLG